MLHRNRRRHSSRPGGKEHRRRGPSALRIKPGFSKNNASRPLTVRAKKQYSTPASAGSGACHQANFRSPIPPGPWSFRRSSSRCRRTSGLNRRSFSRICTTAPLRRRQLLPSPSRRRKTRPHGGNAHRCTPSSYMGGELIVGLEGQKQTIDFAAGSRFNTHFAAFYADCEHEVKPLLTGHRLCLVYNLPLARKSRNLWPSKARRACR